MDESCKNDGGGEPHAVCKMFGPKSKTSVLMAVADGVTKYVSSLLVLLVFSNTWI